MTANASSASSSVDDSTKLAGAADGDGNNGTGIRYLHGFGNTFESECVVGALPRGRNTPRRVPCGLYTEQLSGTAFTSPRATNRRTWLYRIQPSVVVGKAAAATSSSSSSSGNNNRRPFGGVHYSECQAQVDPLRWNPMPLTAPVSPPANDGNDNEAADAAKVDVDFVDGARLVCAAGDPGTKNGIAIYLYACNASMDNNDARDGSNSGKSPRHMYNADGDLLIVPQQGSLQVKTELGVLEVEPNEFVVVPRGVVFQINLLARGNCSDGEVDGIRGDEPAARGYVLENYKGGGFALPELGPIVSSWLRLFRIAFSLLRLTFRMIVSVSFLLVLLGIEWARECARFLPPDGLVRFRQP